MVFAFIQCNISIVINDDPFAPLIKRKKVIADMANPPQIEPKYFRDLVYSKEKIIRIMYWTIAPTVKGGLLWRKLRISHLM